MIDVPKDKAYCIGGACILKYDCIRFKDTTGNEASYFTEPPFETVDDMCTCDYYLEDT